MTSSEHPWVFTVISISVAFEIILVVIFCLFRRKSYKPEVLDEENSCLIIGRYRKYEENSNAKTNFDDAFLTLQFYIRGVQRMEYSNSYKAADPTANIFWFTLRDKILSKTKNKDRLLPLSSGHCIAKVKQHPKLGPIMKTNSAGGIVLDILLTIKEESCPYIFPVFDIKYFEDRDSLLLVNEHMPKGSLRDKLLGVTHLWLHAGNVMADGKLCKLCGYEEELFRAKEPFQSNNDERAGLTDVGQIIFEMATGFPVNYAENINLDPGRKRLTLRRKERLTEIHFEYLKVITNPEIVQLVQFICDEEKCTSLHMAVHHPLFDQVNHIQFVEPENSTITSLDTLYRLLIKRSMSSKGS